MRVLTFVSGYDDAGILKRTFHSLFHRAFSICASVVTPGVRAILHSFLAILAPSISILQVIHIAFGHEGKSGLAVSFLTLLSRLALFFWTAVKACPEIPDLPELGVRLPPLLHRLWMPQSRGGSVLDLRLLL